MVIRYTGILRISNDVNDLWKVILTSSEVSTEEIKIRIQNRVAIDYSKSIGAFCTVQLEVEFSVEF